MTFCIEKFVLAYTNYKQQRP